MRIGIIGAGNIGGTLARRLTQLGHEVSIANSRGPDTLAGLAKETGARPVTVEQAARAGTGTCAGDVVIVTIPEKSVRDLPKGLFDGVSQDVVVVDTGNYYPTQRERVAVNSGDREREDREPVCPEPVVRYMSAGYLTPQRQSTFERMFRIGGRGREAGAATDAG